ncbi:MAG: peptidase [Subtercola sp.]|nr:peptidase [Subtercola sp.]
MKIRSEWAAAMVAAVVVGAVWFGVATSGLTADASAAASAASAVWPGSTAGGELGRDPATRSAVWWPGSITGDALMTAASARGVWPVGPGHTVLRPFEAPVTRYSAGHRGVDIAADVGQPVLATAAGVVSFAGVVVDRPLISIVQSDGYVSTVEPVRPSVAAGTPVAAGQIIGTVAAWSHCDQPCVHLGVRLNGEYVSPLLLLGAVPRAVLLPLESAHPAEGSRAGQPAQLVQPVRSVSSANPVRSVHSADSVCSADFVRLGTGVSGEVRLSQALGRHVGIDLRGAEAGMAEQLLHGSQVGTAVEQVRCRGMPKCVRALRPGPRHSVQQLRDERVDPSGAEPCTSGVQKKRARQAARSRAA